MDFRFDRIHPDDSSRQLAGLTADSHDTQLACGGSAYMVVELHSVLDPKHLCILFIPLIFR